MKTVVKRLISLALAILLIVTSMPVVALASTEPTISINDFIGVPGHSVTVNINIENNPGILVAILSLVYDNTAMTLTNVELDQTFGGQYTPSPDLQSPVALMWESSELADNISNGTMFKLTFEISENAQVGETYDVIVNYNDGDVTNMDEEDVNFHIDNATVNIVNGKPGDINRDQITNAKDLTRMRRYFAQHEVEVDMVAMDCNGDGSVNAKDLTRLRRYFAKHPVKLYYGEIVSEICEHTSLTVTEEKKATCTEDGNIPYWTCDSCGERFSDATGSKPISREDTITKGEHKLTNIPYKAPTTETAGNEKHWKCDICGKLFGNLEGTIELQEDDVVILPLETNQHNITYNHLVKLEQSDGTYAFVQDDYMEAHKDEIINPNEIVYTEGVGIPELIENFEVDGKKVSARGYRFLGWYDSTEETAKRVYEISPEANKDIRLYGRWDKVKYTITYLQDANSLLPRVENDTYTIDTGRSLQKPAKMSNMVWVGWSDENGKIVDSIPRGTSGNIELRANWMSKRNQTIPNLEYSNQIPAIVADEEDGIYAFTYDIGRILNVPIQSLGKDYEFNLVAGASREINTKVITQTTKTDAESVADTISNATTKSDSWTLSEEMSKSTEISQEQSTEVTSEQTEKAKFSYSETGKYTLSAGIGGSEEHIDETGSSTKTTKGHEFGVGINVGAKADLKASVTKNTPFKNASVEGSVGLNYKYTNITEKEEYEKHTDKTSSYWNVDEGFEFSQTQSNEHEFSQSLSQSIKDTYKYGETLEYATNQTTSKTVGSTNTQSREYASSVSYSEATGKEIEIKENLYAAEEGYYRKVIAANYRVFAVVIYDIKENTFSVMTYSLKIKDSEHAFTDYSTVSEFDDYENGVLPFEVPAFVGDYVYGLKGYSDGLKINDDGIVTGYGYKDPETGICYKSYDEATNTYSEPCDTDVIIPRFYVNEKKEIIKVKGFDKKAFKGTNVTSVYIPDGVTTIPEGAFEDCKSLYYVHGGTLDTIEKDAFKNCTNLYELDIPYTVETLVDGAFTNVDAVTVNASNADVFDAALKSGAKNITINITDMEGSIDGKNIVIPETVEGFYINGGGKTVTNVSVESTSSTKNFGLNNITIDNKSDIPLKLASENVELTYVNVKSNSLAMKCDAENTKIILVGTNNIITSGQNAVLSKNVRLYESDTTATAGVLKVTGNVLVYGTVSGTQYISQENPYTIKYLTKDEYDNMLKSHTVMFDAGEGSVDVTSKEVALGDKIGELPTPTRDYYTFDGWYDASGTKVTADYTMPANDIELTAHWTKNAVVEALASEMPSDAELVDEWWTYTLTETEKSTETSREGWTQHDYDEWEVTGTGTWKHTTYPSGFDKSNYLYVHSTSALSSYENATTKREVSSPSFYNYIYWHWCRGNDSCALKHDRSIGDCRDGTYTTFDAFESSTNKSYNSVAKAYRYDYSSCCGDSYWWFRIEVYAQTYKDYAKLYTYTKVTDNLPSETEVVNGETFNGGTVSNVQHVVQYIPK